MPKDKKRIRGRIEALKNLKTSDSNLIKDLISDSEKEFKETYKHEKQMNEDKRLRERARKRHNFPRDYDVFKEIREEIRKREKK